MRDHQKEFPVGMMCKVFNVSRGGFYPIQKWSSSNRDNENRMLLSEIMRIHQDSKARYGSLRITQELNVRGFKASRPRVARHIHTKEYLRRSNASA